MRNTLLVGLLLTKHLVCGQSPPKPYRVGLCPGPLKAYGKLMNEVKNVVATNNVANDEKALKKCLTSWDSVASLSRYRVEIKRLDTRETWVWKKGADRQPSVFAALASVESTAGRGGDLRAGRPGDNQRCFFRDTTVVVDTLYIHRGDFAETTLPTLTIDGNAHTLPLSRNRKEWVVSASVLPGVATGRYHTARVQLGEGEPLVLTVYLLAASEREQLVQSTQNWMAFEPVACSQLTDQLAGYLIQTWGGKTCAGSALYVFAQRTAMARLLSQHQITCTP